MGMSNTIVILLAIFGLLTHLGGGSEFYQPREVVCESKRAGTLSVLSAYDTGNLKMQVENQIITKEWKEWETGESSYSLTARKLVQGNKEIKFVLEDTEGNRLDTKTINQMVTC